MQLSPNEASKIQIKKEIKALETIVQSMEKMQSLINVTLLLFGMLIIVFVYAMRIM